jgi:hypothetical protein
MAKIAIKAHLSFMVEPPVIVAQSERPAEPFSPGIDHSIDNLLLVVISRDAMHRCSIRLSKGAERLSQAPHLARTVLPSEVSALAM